MEKATVKFILKNNRYRLIHTKSNYYLIDADHSIWGYIFFFFNWFIPQKAYIIDERTADDLVVQRLNAKRQNSFPKFGIGIMMAVLAAFIPNIFQYFGSESKVTYEALHQFGDTLFVIPSTTYIIFLLASVVAPAVLFRAYLSIRSKKRLLETLDIDKLPVIKMNILPIKVANVLKAIGVYVFFGFLLFATAFLLIILDGYWIISLSLTVIFLLFSLTNYLSVIPGDYKIRNIKEK